MNFPRHGSVGWKWEWCFMLENKASRADKINQKVVFAG